MNPSARRIHRSLQNDRLQTERRSGVVTLELILAFPILLILLLAVIEFGLIYTTTQSVSFASRYGAKLASEESNAGIPTLNTSGGGSRMRNAIDQYLTDAGISASCRVTFQHNIGGPAASQTDSPAAPAECDCDAPIDNFPLGEPYVRVTVCVALKDNVPDLLSTFGFSLADALLEETTTFPYEN